MYFKESDGENSDEDSSTDRFELAALALALRPLELPVLVVLKIASFLPHIDLDALKSTTCWNVCQTVREFVPAPPACKFFAHGRCNRGQNCKFAH